MKFKKPAPVGTVRTIYKLALWPTRCECGTVVWLERYAVTQRLEQWADNSCSWLTTARRAMFR